MCFSLASCKQFLMPIKHQKKIRKRLILHLFGSINSLTYVWHPTDFGFSLTKLIITIAKALFFFTEGLNNLSRLTARAPPISSSCNDGEQVTYSVSCPLAPNYKAFLWAKLYVRTPCPGLIGMFLGFLIYTPGIMCTCMMPAIYVFSWLWNVNKRMGHRFSVRTSV